MDRDKYEQLTGHPLHSGRDNWRSLCPAHFESTPSFFIHKETYLCHCFGCGVRGSLDNVLAKALEMVPATIRYELAMPPLLDFKTFNKRPQKAPIKFEQAWLAPFPRIATHPYLTRRKFKQETIILHGARWDKREKRIVFPLRSLGGPVVGVTGRATNSLEPKWKYYWSVKKGQILYQALDTFELNIITEGIFDTMWLSQHGYRGAVALLGSTATKAQVELIKQNTDHVCLFLDNDEAGRIGQEYLASKLKSSIKVTIAKYSSSKKDPQELTKEELHMAIEDRETYVEYCNRR